MFGIDDMAGASLVGSGASLLGGLFGGKKTSLKTANKQAEIQYNWQRKLNQTSIQDRVADATAAGVHPLYAIGAQVSPGGISMPQVDDSNSSRFEKMGQNIERAVTAYSTASDRALMKESTLLDIERKKIENETLRNQALGSRMALQNQAGMPPSNQSVVKAKDAYERMHLPMGYKDGVKNLHKLAIDEDGDVIRMYNEEDLGDNDAAQFAHLLRYTFPDYAQAGINKFKRGVKKLWKGGK